MWYMVCLMFIPEPWCAIFKVIPLAILVAALATKLKETTDPSSFRYSFSWRLTSSISALSYDSELRLDLKDYLNWTLPGVLL